MTKKTKKKDTRKNIKVQKKTHKRFMARAIVEREKADSIMNRVLDQSEGD